MEQKVTAQRQKLGMLWPTWSNSYCLLWLLVKAMVISRIPNCADEHISAAVLSWFISLILVLAKIYVHIPVDVPVAASRSVWNEGLFDSDFDYSHTLLTYFLMFLRSVPCAHPHILVYV